MEVLKIRSHDFGTQTLFFDCILLSLKEFYGTALKSPSHVCATFKSSSREEKTSFESTGIDDEFLYAALDAIRGSSVSVQKCVIRSVVGCLLDETTPLYPHDR